VRLSLGAQHELSVGLPNGFYAQSSVREGSRRFRTGRVGDYNGDGVPEILVQTGTLLIQRVWTGSEFSSSVWVEPEFGSVYNVDINRGDFNGDGKDDFLAATLSTIGNGTSENLGKTINGFDEGVWLNAYAFKDTQVSF